MLIKPALMVIFFLMVMFGSAYAVHRHLPDQHNPLKLLDLSDPIGWATSAKLANLEGDPQACFSLLDAGGIEYDKLQDGEADDPCGLSDALFLKRSDVPYSAPVKLSCPLAASLALWERQVLQPAAEEYLNTSIERIETYGSFSCRRINGRSSGRWSEHATANAIDIAGFRMADGRRVTVLSDWDDGAETGQFLEAVFRGACSVFDAALGPNYNAAHANHFHFDRGPWNTCK